MKKIENNTKKERNKAEAFIYSLLRLFFSLSANHRHIRSARIRIKVLANQMQHAAFLYSLCLQNYASATFLLCRKYRYDISGITTKVSCEVALMGEHHVRIEISDCVMCTFVLKILKFFCCRNRIFSAVNIVKAN